jgi:RNA 2',3'-cyclic 3'-phosphodiesterase
VSDERARLFVALELPAGVRSSLAGWRDQALRGLSGVRPVADESLHVTLCFLGSVAVEELDAVAQACAVVDGAPGARLRVGRGIWLPSRRPRVLAVELEDVGGGLAWVQSALSDALVAGGWYKPEQRPYLAHVTVARVGRGARVPRGSDAVGGSPAELEFSGSTVTLFLSRLSPAGSRYEGLASVNLG